MCFCVKCLLTGGNWGRICSSHPFWSWRQAPIPFAVLFFVKERSRNFAEWRSFCSTNLVTDNSPSHFFTGHAGCELIVCILEQLSNRIKHFRQFATRNSPVSKGFYNFVQSRTETFSCDKQSSNLKESNQAKEVRHLHRSSAQSKRQYRKDTNLWGGPCCRGYSQNFLVDESISREIVIEAGLDSGDTVFEIGPGVVGVLYNQHLPLPNAGSWDLNVIEIQWDGQSLCVQHSWLLLSRYYLHRMKDYTSSLQAQEAWLISFWTWVTRS